VLGLGLDSELHYFSIFTENKKKMSTLSSANVTDVDLILKERTHMRLCINMLIFAHNLGNWLIVHRRLFEHRDHKQTEYTLMQFL